jgi:hypothetical protein
MAIDLQSIGSFDPDVLAVLYRAFDDVWLQLEGQTEPALHDATRDAIATALIQAAMAGERDPEKLRCYAMNRARALGTIYWMSKQEPSRPARAQGTLRLRSRRRSHRSPV